MAIKIVRSAVEIVDGIPSMTVYGHDGGKEVGISVPLPAVMTLVADTRRKAAALAFQKDRVESAQWFSTTLLTAKSYDVGTLPATDGEKVALVFDRDRPTEIGFAIEPAHALELGRQLQDEAERANLGARAKS